jgi:hypothetical protein
MTLLSNSTRSINCFFYISVSHAARSVSNSHGPANKITVWHNGNKSLDPEEVKFIKCGNTNDS